MYESMTRPALLTLCRERRIATQRTNTAEHLRMKLREYDALQPLIQALDAATARRKRIAHRNEVEWRLNRGTRRERARSRQRIGARG